MCCSENSMADKTQKVMFDIDEQTLGHVICGCCNRMVNLDHCDVGLAEWRHVFCWFCCGEISIDDGTPLKADHERR